MLERLFKKEKVLSIKKKKFYSEKEAIDNIPYIEYSICLNRKVVGYIELSLVMNDYMYYFGHIGYHIYPPFRGHHYASKACILLMQEALKLYNMQEFIITCNPDNIPSIKTIEKLPKVTFIERVNVPKDHILYLNGDKEKLVYKVSL